MGKAKRRNISRAEQNPRTSAPAGGDRSSVGGNRSKARSPRAGAPRSGHTPPTSPLARGDDPVREVVLELWRQVRGSWPRTDDLIARTLRRAQQLNDGQRDQIVSIFHGMVIHHRKIDLALDSLDLPPDEQRHQPTLAYTAFFLLKGWLKKATLKELPAPGVAWFDPAKIQTAIEAEADPVRRLALLHGLPDFLAARLLTAYPDQATAIAEALGERAPLTLRANALKTTRDELLTLLTQAGLSVKPAALAPQAISFERRVNPFRLPAFQDGLFELQDESSQLAAEIVAPPPGSLVIDFCAGAGGKTLALGALMKNKGRLIALDTQPRKLVELRKRAARAGLSNLRALPLSPDGGFPPELEALRGKAARVLVDVPCSGTGAWRRNPEARWRLTEADLARLPLLQAAIARRAMEWVAPGGRLIYATCSILPEENEQVVENLLQPLAVPEPVAPAQPAAPPEPPAPAEGGAAPPPAAAPTATAVAWQPVLVKEILGKARAANLCDPAGRYLKLLPTAGTHDGFFTAVLRRL